MSNVATSEYEPVAGETRYRKYFKAKGIRIRIIVMSNKLPEEYYWPNGDKVRESQFMARFIVLDLDN